MLRCCRGLRRSAVCAQLFGKGNTHNDGKRRALPRASSASDAPRLRHRLRRAGEKPRREAFVRVNDPDKLRAVFDVVGNDMNSPSLHINFGVIEEPCCKASFIRSAFLAGGSVTNPAKRYHSGLATTHYSVSRETYSVLLTEMGFSPKEAQRKGDYLLYFKKSEHIEDLLTTIGAPVRCDGYHVRQGRKGHEKQHKPQGKLRFPQMPTRSSRPRQSRWRPSAA